MVNAKDLRSLVRHGGFSTRPKKGRNAHRRVRKLIGRYKKRFFKDFDSTLGYPGEGPSGGQDRKRPKAPRTCHNCRKPGHEARACTAPRREVKTRERKECKICRSPKHDALHCPSSVARASQVADQHEAKADFALTNTRSPRDSKKGDIPDESGQEEFDEDMKVFRKHVAPMAAAPVRGPMRSNTAWILRRCGAAPDDVAFWSTSDSLRTDGVGGVYSAATFTIHLVYPTILAAAAKLRAAQEAKLQEYLEERVAKAAAEREQAEAGLAAAKELADAAAAAAAAAATKAAKEAEAVAGIEADARVTIETLMQTLNTDDPVDRDNAVRRVMSSVRSKIGNSQLHEDVVSRLAQHMAQCVTRSANSQVVFERERVCSTTIPESLYLTSWDHRQRKPFWAIGWSDAAIAAHLKKLPSDSRVSIAPSPVHVKHAALEELLKTSLFGLVCTPLRRAGGIWGLLAYGSIMAVETVQRTTSLHTAAECAGEFVKRTAAHTVVAAPSLVAWHYVGRLVRQLTSPYFGPAYKFQFNGRFLASSLRHWIFKRFVEKPSVKDVLADYGMPEMQPSRPPRDTFTEVVEKYPPGKSPLMCDPIAVAKTAIACIGAVTLGWLASTFLHYRWNRYWNRRNCLNKLSLFRAKPLDLPKMTDTCLEGQTPCPTQPGFKILRQGDKVCVPKAKLSVLFGVKDVVPTVFRACHHNETISLAGRVGKLIPSTRPGCEKPILQAWRGLTEIMVPVLQRMVPKTTRGMPRHEWLASFPPGKQAMLRRVMEYPDEAALARNEASSFVKPEKANKPADRVQEVLGRDNTFKDPRMIQGGRPELTVQAGPTVRKAAKTLRRSLMPKRFDLKDIAAGRHIVYACGLTPTRIGECVWKMEQAITGMLLPGERLRWVEDDQSRFDLHLTKGAFSFVHKAYDWLLPKRVGRLLRRGTSRGTTNLGTKYSIPFTMQSGWPDTSYADSLVNAVLKMQIHGIGRRWFTIICGDDSLTCTVDSEWDRLGHSEGLERAYAIYGLEVEAKSSHFLSDVEFCSGVFVESTSTHYLVPKFGKLVARLGVDMQCRSHQGTVEWAHSIVSSLRCFAKMFPGLEGMARALVGQLPAVKGSFAPTVDPYKLDYTKGEAIPPRDQSYHLFCRYGLSAADQTSLLCELASVKVGCVMDGPIINGMAVRDL